MLLPSHATTLKLTSNMQADRKTNISYDMQHGDNDK